jgi:hypothetical protein
MAAHPCGLGLGAAAAADQPQLHHLVINARGIHRPPILHTERERERNVGISAHASTKRQKTN